MQEGKLLIGGSGYASWPISGSRYARSYTCFAQDLHG
jgi:hypothetical protein